MEIVRGISFPKNEKSLEPKEGHVACLRTANVQRDVEWDDLWFVPKERVKRDEQYVRPGDSRRRADRVIWVGLGRTPDPKVDVPAIVVEFVSKDKRDRERDYVVKRHEYMQLGVREYWIIDRFERAMTVVRPDGELRVEENDIYTTGLLPNFELPLKDLLGLSDDWQQDAGD